MPRLPLHGADGASLSHKPIAKSRRLLTPRGMAVATRNIRHFEDIGIEIFDPWNGT